MFKRRPWTPIFLFELRYHLRQPLFYLLAFFSSLLVFTWATGGSLQESVGKIHLNAPLVIFELLTRGKLLGLFALTIFLANAALRDFDHRSDALFFSKPIRPSDYLLGRFVGGLTTCLLMYLVVATTLGLTFLLPGLDPERLGPFRLGPYVFALGVLILPSLFSLGAILFALACKTRSLMATYAGVMSFLVVSRLANQTTAGLDNEFLGQMIDPFALEALYGAVKYWTVVESNTLVPALTGPLLYNRLLWLALGTLALVFCFREFDPSPSSRRKTPPAPPSDAPPRRHITPHGKVPFQPTFAPASGWIQFLHQTRFEVARIVQSVPFLVLLALGISSLVGAASSVGRWFGTGVTPRTYLMLEAIQDDYVFLMVLLVVLYGGEAIWRERSVGMGPLYDAAPTPNGVYLGAKLMALLLVMVLFVLCGVLTTLGVQVWKGHHDFELGLYATGAAFTLVYFLLICFLSCFFQVLAPNKFLGYFFMLAFVVGWDMIEEFGFEHHLYRFASLPATPYSDLNGFGHYLAPFLWLSLYWAFFAAALLGLSILFFQRGTATPWRQRLLIARGRWQGPARALISVGAVGFVATGSWIFYNTNVLNEYVSSVEAQERQVDYEKNYRQYENVPLPRITRVRANVHIFPDERRVEIQGSYRLENQGQKPIQDLHFNLPPRIRIDRLGLPPHRVLLEDDLLGYHIVRLQDPLRPQQATDFEFDLTLAHRGFVNHGSDPSIVGNGTYFNNRDVFPILGYAWRKQLESPESRRKHGLEPFHRLAEVDDLRARQNTPRSLDADWVHFETTVSTSADQIAVAPGSLAKQWTEGGRRYFHYRMEQPIPFHIAYLSARYKVVRDHWNGIDVEIYHHPGHKDNVPRMLDATKKSLDYYTTQFSPYQFQEIRLVEFPRYTRIARAFPGLITFSERISLARPEGPEDIDSPFYVTAHELAHQWWGHQVIGGDVQGVAMLAESLAQYSALMVMEKEYGPQQMRRFLKYELDTYLRRRGREQMGEVPLARVERQEYIYYQKGSLAMYALRDALGEERLNRAMARFVAKVAFQEPPFTTSMEFLEEVRRETPKDLEYLIEDLFQTVTLFDNKVAEATISPQSDGRFLVRLATEAKKMRVDAEGMENEVPIDDWIDIAIFGRGENREEKVLFLEKRRIHSQRMEFEILVDQRPLRVGIDPFNKLIDRNSSDNLKRIES